MQVVMINSTFYMDYAQHLEIFSKEKLENDLPMLEEEDDFKAMVIYKMNKSLSIIPIVEDSENKDLLAIEEESDDEDDDKGQDDDEVEVKKHKVYKLATKYKLQLLEEW